MSINKRRSWMVYWSETSHARLASCTSSTFNRMWCLSILQFRHLHSSSISCAHPLTQHLHSSHRFLSPFHSWRAQYVVHNISRSSASAEIWQQGRSSTSGGLSYQQPFACIQLHRVTAHDIITSPACSFCIRFPKLCRIYFYVVWMDASDNHRWLLFHFAWAPKFTSTSSRHHGHVVCVLSICFIYLSMYACLFLQVSMI